MVSILVAYTIGNPVSSAKVMEASAAGVDPLNLTWDHNRLTDGWLADSDSTTATESRHRSETSSVRRTEEVLVHCVSAGEAITEGDPRGEQWKEGRPLMKDLELLLLICSRRNSLSLSSS